MRGTQLNVFRIAAALAVVAGGAAAVAPAAATAASSFTIWRIAGSAKQCSTPPVCGDSGAATSARLSFPEALAVTRRGNLYIADWGDNEIRRVTPNGRITRIAGDGTLCENAPRCGDGGAATSAKLSSPDGIAVTRSGAVYVADTGDNDIRMISPRGTITRVAGTGSPCAKPPACGDGGRATAATLTGPTGLVLDGSGNLYIADTGDQEIRKLSPTGKMTRVAGNGKACSHPSSCGDTGQADKARLNSPNGLALDRSGNLYIADNGDQEIRRVSRAGTIATVAGTGVVCSSPPSCGDGGPATSATLNYPDGVAVGAGGNLVIADSADNEIREVSHGTIRRLAGTGTGCTTPPSCGDNHGAQRAALNYPDAIASTGGGNLFVADTGDHEVRWLSPARPHYIATSKGSYGLAAFSPEVAKKTVTVRFVVGRSAKVTLIVRHSHHSEVVATGRARAGFGVLRWRRRFRGKPAPSGHYKLTIKATIGRHSASSTVHVKL